LRGKIAASDSALASPIPRFLKNAKPRVARGETFSYIPGMKSLLAAISAGLLLASCVPSTPQARIERNPGKFAALGAKHQSLVQQGQIARGMPPDAVYLAWGAPSRSFQGYKDGKNTERWDYAGSRPVYTTGFYGSYGYGPYGYRGRYGYSGFGFGMGPEVAYIPYRVASVWFVNSRVESWERAR
jgi:hypothetical protein